MDDSVSLARAHTQAHFFIRLYTHTLSPTFLRTHSLSHIYSNTLSIFLFCTHSNYLSLSHTHTLSHTNSHINSHTLSQSLTHNSFFILFCDKTCSKKYVFCICQWMNLECFWTLFDAQPLTREHFECMGGSIAQM